jgi:hypothetical protein
LKGAEKPRFRFQEMQLVFLLFVLLAVCVCALQRNVSYQGRKRLLKPYAAETASSKVMEQPAECLLLWEGDELGQLGRKMMEQVLTQMKIPYTSREGKEENVKDLRQYRTVVLSMTNLGRLNEAILELLEWVEEGGRLMVVYPPVLNGTFRLAADDLGVQSIGNRMEYVSEVEFEDSFMLTGGLKALKLPAPYESSLQVHLLPECSVYLWAGASGAMPLIWTYENGEGRVVFCNLGHMEKDFRGFYSSAYSLLDDFCVWQVINGSAFYMDAFPAPAPEGENAYIRREYGMSVSAFHKQVWWNDLHNLAKSRGLRYTGFVTQGEPDHEAESFGRQSNTQDFLYYGSLLLNQGGELGLYGCADMEEGVQELLAACRILFPEERFQVYSPPANVLSEEERRLLKETFPDICAIAGAYLPGGPVYEQEFGIGEDGLVNTPKILSGYTFGKQEWLMAVSELNIHYVSSHAQHFYDVLAENGGQRPDWKGQLDRLSAYVDWLYQAAPKLRCLTGTELAGAVQRYADVRPVCQRTGEGIRLTLENFVDEAWFLLRCNNFVPDLESVEGGALTRLTGELYLLEARNGTVRIREREEEK